jgi:AcrR family transcriptional regulator
MSTNSPARQRVLNAATRLYTENGYDGVSMRDLAQELGIRAPSLYSHFPCKADLLVAVVTPVQDSFEELLDAAPDSPVTMSQRRAWLREMVEWSQQNGAMTRFIQYDPGVMHHPTLKGRADGLVKRLMDIIHSFEVSSPQLARSIVGYVLWPFTSAWQVEFTDKAKDELVEQIEALIDHAHRTADSG